MGELAKIIMEGALLVTALGALGYAVKKGVDYMHYLNPGIKKQCRDEYSNHLEDTDKSK